VKNEDFNITTQVRYPILQAAIYEQTKQPMSS